MSVDSYKKGFAWVTTQEKVLSYDYLCSLRNKVINKFNMINIYKNPDSVFVNNRLDYYCGLVDGINLIIKEKFFEEKNK